MIDPKIYLQIKCGNCGCRLNILINDDMIKYYKKQKYVICSCNYRNRILSSQLKNINLNF